MKDSMDLKVTTERLDSHEMKMVIQVPEEQVQKEMRRVAQRIGSKSNIPGFRKGKVPYAVVIQRYGEEALRAEAAEEVMERAYKEAVEQEQIRAYDVGRLEAMELDPLQFTIVLPLPPEVELGDYRSIRIDSPTVEVTEEDIAHVLEHLQQENAVLEPVDGRGAEPGDVLVISAKGETENGALVFDIIEQEVVFDPDAEDQPAPGFYAALQGMKPDEVRTFNLMTTVPGAEDQPALDVAFNVHLYQLTQRLLPGIDDDLARTVGDFESLAEMKEGIAAQILEHRQEESQEAYADQVVRALVELSSIKYPPVMLEEELDNRLAQLREQIQKDLHLSFEDYLRVVQTTEETVREDLKPVAHSRLQQSLALITFIEAEGLSVSKEEVDERIDVLSQPFGPQAGPMRQLLEDNRSRIQNDLLSQKAVARLTAIARGEADANPADEPAAPAETEPAGEEEGVPDA
ncbi:MAG: trigger factor [Anaerolineae bacterium]|nr:trigger factor [Anaerolineae bacterium]